MEQIIRQRKLSEIGNEQLQQVIRHMDRNIQEEMQQREEKLGRTGERSLAIVAGLVVFMLLLCHDKDLLV